MDHEAAPKAAPEAAAYSLRVVVDERETALFERCAALMAADYAPALGALAKEVLHLGDVCLRDGAGRDVCIIERKSLADLKASIRDARYEEQSYRLLNAGGLAPHDIVYVIEGAMASLRSAADRRCAYSAMTSLNAFKGFSVVRTHSVQETAELVLAMADKHARNARKGLFPASARAAGGAPDAPPASYCSVVKKVKKENVRADNFGEIVLTQIPGVGAAAAVAVMARFGSLLALAAAMAADSACLAGITVPSGAAQRALGKNVAAGVRKYLLGEPDAPPPPKKEPRPKKARAAAPDEEPKARRRAPKAATPPVS